MKRKWLFFFILVLLLTGILTHIILFIPPDTYSLIAVFVIIFLIFFLIFFMPLRHTRKSFLFSLGIIFLLLLRYLKSLTLLTGILAILFLVITELSFTKK